MNKLLSKWLASSPKSGVHKIQGGSIQVDSAPTKAQATSGCEDSHNKISDRQAEILISFFLILLNVQIDQVKISCNKLTLPIKTII